MRVLTDLHKNQIDILSTICEEEGISRSEAIRRAITHMGNARQSSKDEEKQAIIARTFGAFKGKNVFSETHVENIRQEWEDRLEDMWGPSVRHDYGQSHAKSGAVHDRVTSQKNLHTDKDEK